MRKHGADGADDADDAVMESALGLGMPTIEKLRQNRVALNERGRKIYARRVKLLMLSACVTDIFDSLGAIRLTCRAAKSFVYDFTL